MEWFDDASRVVKQSGVILCPTDTVWGLSANAFSEKAYDKIFEIKQRPKNKSVILLMHSLEQLSNFVEDDLHSVQVFLQKQLRPTTIVYQKTKNLPAYLLAQDGSIAIRIPKEKWLVEFLQRLDLPLISTSANTSGHSTPKSFQEIELVIQESVDYIIPFKQDAEEPKESSQIVKWENNEVVWLRK